MTRVALVCAAVGLCTAAPSVVAAAPNHRDSAHRYQLEVPAGWRRQHVPRRGEKRALLIGWRGRGQDAIAITRIDGRNPLARRGRKKFFDAMEASLKDDYPGYRRIYRKIHRVRRVRAMDLVFRRGSGDQSEVVAMRMLIFSRYTLTIVTNTKLRRARRVIRSFVPYFARKS